MLFRCTTSISVDKSSGLVREDIPPGDYPLVG